jgi:hypothetical protein
MQYTKTDAHHGKQGSLFQGKGRAAGLLDAVPQPKKPDESVCCSCIEANEY